MRLDDRLDQEKASKLEEQFDALISSDPDLTTKEAIMALMWSMGSVILHIECPGCRRLHAKIVREMAPKVARDALVEASKNPDQPNACFH